MLGSESGELVLSTLCGLISCRPYVKRGINIVLRLRCIFILGIIGKSFELQFSVLLR